MRETERESWRRNEGRDETEMDGFYLISGPEEESPPETGERERESLARFPQALAE